MRNDIQFFDCLFRITPSARRVGQVGACRGRRSRSDQQPARTATQARTAAARRVQRDGTHAHLSPPTPEQDTLLALTSARIIVSSRVVESYSYNVHRSTTTAATAHLPIECILLHSTPAPASGSIDISRGSTHTTRTLDTVAGSPRPFRCVVSLRALAASASSCAHGARSPLYTPYGRKCSLCEGSKNWK